MWIKAKRTLVGDYGLLEGGKKADIEDRIADQLIKKGYAEATEPDEGAEPETEAEPEPVLESAPEATEPDEGEKPQRRGRRGN